MVEENFVEVHEIDLFFSNLHILIVIFHVGFRIFIEYIDIGNKGYLD
jgi:hypothetical protein